MLREIKLTHRTAIAWTSQNDTTIGFGAHKCRLVYYATFMASVDMFMVQLLGSGVQLLAEPSSKTIRLNVETVFAIF